MEATRVTPEQAALLEKDLADFESSQIDETVEGPDPETE